MLHNTKRPALRQHLLMWEVGVRLNANKTEVMCVEDIQPTNTHTSITCFLTASAACMDISAKAHHSMESVKMQLFRSTLESVLLYSCEALVVTDIMAKCIDASHRVLMKY